MYKLFKLICGDNLHIICTGFWWKGSMEVKWFEGLV